MRPFRRSSRLLPACLTLLLPTATLAVAQEAKAPPLALAGARAFRLTVADLPANAAEPLDPASAAWEQVPATPINLNRTPRIYQTEPTAQPKPPAAEVRVLRQGESLLIRLAWTDTTHNAPRADDAKKGEGGDPKILYKQPTSETSSFSDAAAVMLPQDWKGPAFPSLVMGDDKSTAMLYQWSASRGTDVIEAHGRASTAKLGRPFPARSHYQDDKWTAVLKIPAPTIDAGYPVAFAIWDGEHNDRDGIKFFSTWYVLAPQRANPGANRP